jgi:hypothetical protein
MKNGRRATMTITNLWFILLRLIEPKNRGMKNEERKKGRYDYHKSSVHPFAVDRTAEQRNEE